MKSPLKHAAARLLAVGVTAAVVACGVGHLVGSKPSIPRFEIELDGGACVRLRQDERHFVPARVRINGAEYAAVAVHLKGQGTFRELDDRPSLTLDFSRFAAGQRWEGFRRIHLNNCVDDESLCREWLGAELFRSAGVPAPRVTHAQVILNRRRLGLYVLKEAFTQEFLAMNFGRGDGALYEHTDGDGLDPGGREPDVLLQRLASAAHEPDLQKRWQELDGLLDVERFASFLSMEVLTCHWDGYGLGRNNYRIYSDPVTGKLVFLPTGLDQIFANPHLSCGPHMSGMVARSFLETPEGAAWYQRRLTELVRADPTGLQHELRKKAAVLKRVLPLSAGAALEEEIDHLRVQMTERYSFLRQETTRAFTPATLLTSLSHENCTERVHPH